MVEARDIKMATGILTYSEVVDAGNVALSF
jgi:hypothetical protein